MTRLCLAALLLSIALPTWAAAPVARLRADGAVMISLPADVLARDEVRSKLPSGLTTTFVVVGSAGDRRGAARIEVRYEPWDEVYFVTTRAADNTPQTHRLASLERLQAWWRTASLPLFLGGSAPRSVQITLEVLPFSIAEQQETQRWLARALQAAQQGGTPEAPGGTGSANSVLDLIIGTSIQRRPLVRLRWDVQVAR